MQLAQRKWISRYCWYVKSPVLKPVGYFWRTNSSREIRWRRQSWKFRTELIGIYPSIFHVPFSPSSLPFHCSGCPLIPSTPFSAAGSATYCKSIARGSGHCGVLSAPQYTVCSEVSANSVYQKLFRTRDCTPGCPCPNPGFRYREIKPGLEF